MTHIHELLAGQSTRQNRHFLARVKIAVHRPLEKSFAPGHREAVYRFEKCLSKQKHHEWRSSRLAELVEVLPRN